MRLGEIRSKPLRVWAVFAAAFLLLVGTVGHLGVIPPPDGRGRCSSPLVDVWDTKSSPVRQESEALQEARRRGAERRAERARERGEVPEVYVDLFGQEIGEPRPPSLPYCTTEARDRLRTAAIAGLVVIVVTGVVAWLLGGPPSNGRRLDESDDVGRTLP